MTESTIGGLPVSAEGKDGAILPAAQNGETKSVTIDLIAAYIRALRG